MIDLLKFNKSALEIGLTKHHEIYDLPCKAELAENIFANFLASNTSNVEWKAGSHSPGSDVFIKNELRSLGYSIKSAKEPLNGKWLHISSYRTTKHKELEDKKNKIREIEKTIAGYAIFARVESESKKEKLKAITYKVYLISPELLNIDTFNIKAKDNGNYEGSNEYGIRLSITNAMSAQVWLDVPMSLVNDSPFIQKLCESGPFNIKLWY